MVQVLGPISLDEFYSRIHEILDGVQKEGQLWEVRLREDTRGFVVGPLDVCGQVLGLIDEEYGWPSPIKVEDVTHPDDLPPRRRRHPIYVRRGKPAGMGISMGELDLIRQSSDRDTSDNSGK